MLKKLTLLLTSLILVQGCTGGGDDEADKNVIKIGEFGSLTGSEATFGQSTHNGVLLAVEEVNKAGGIKGKQIKLITLDNQSKPEEAASAVNRLISQDKVVAIIGEVASSRTLAAAPIAQQNKIPLITPASTNPKVTEVGDYIFRVCFIDPFQGTVMARFAMDNLDAKKVAILRDVKSDYSIGLANYFVEEVKKRGGEVVADLSYQAGDIDFKAQLTQMRSKDADVIFIPGYYTEVGLIARQARQLGIDAPLLGGDGWDSSKLTEIGQDAIKGNYFSTHYSTELESEIVDNFVAAYKAKYEQNPDAFAALGYDAAKLLFDAIGRAEKIEPKAIRDAIASTAGFKGVTGDITINSSRNADKSAVVVQVQDEEYKFITTVKP